jgi:hypothetical protein
MQSANRKRDASGNRERSTLFTTCADYAAALGVDREGLGS